jgi:hypothetical protein
LFRQGNILVLLIAVLVLPGPRLMAQSGAAELEIVVRDPAGLAAPNATVLLIDAERGQQRSGVTGPDGALRLLGLQPGSYRVEADKEQFATGEGVVRLQTGDRATIELRLALRGQQDTLEVRAEQPLLETGRGGVATVVDETLVEGLPLDGRNFVPLVATLPGVALPRGSAFPRLNGSRPRTNEYIYDGVSVLQPEPTPRAMNSFRLAEAEARSLGQPCVESHHLVLGLFLLGSGVQFNLLRKFGCTAESLRQGIAAIEPASMQTQAINGFILGLSAVQALERAGQAAATMSHTYVGTEHVLLGLLSEETGGASRLFAAHKVDVAKARKAILDEYTQA